MPINDRQISLLEEWQQISRRQLSRYADQWIEGRIDLAEFQRLVKLEIKDLYIASTWTATGSPDATTFADYGRAGRRIRDQYAFLADFFDEIEAGDLSLAQIKSRAGMYANSSRQIMEEVANARDGLPQLPFSPGDGSTQCRSNCNCTLRKEQVDGGWDIYWELNPGESCPDCIRRQRNSPLRVRGGRITNPGVWG
jgi:hypothetical protein